MVDTDLNEFNKCFETWLLSKGFEPYGYEFHMKYERPQSGKNIVTKNQCKFIVWMKYNMDELGIETINYRLKNNLNLVIEKIEYSSKAISKCCKLVFKDNINSPSTIKEILLTL